MVSFVGTRTVLRVRGELDLLSAPQLRAILDAVIDRGHHSVVLDLAELDFMDAAGLSVVAAGIRRLLPSGQRLGIRSPSTMIRRILDLTDLAKLVDLEPTEPVPDTHRLRPAQSTSQRQPGKLVLSDLAHVLRQVRSMQDDLVDAALRLVVALARATVGGAGGASVSLRRDGRLLTVAASDQTVLDMDFGQYDTGEGLCVDASIEGRRFHVVSLDEETRWPAFTPRAQALGINAILSCPLVSRDRPIGALNIYSRTAAAFSPSDEELASVFATEASIILTRAGMEVQDAELDGRLREALSARQVIAQAQGILMEREGICGDDAYAALRRSSQRTNTPLLERAEDIVASARRSAAGLRRPLVAHDA